jgi:hypothetical protein
MASTPSAAAALIKPLPSGLDVMGQTTQIANLMNAGQEQKQDIQTKQLQNQQLQMQMASQKAMMTAMQNVSQRRNSLTGTKQDNADSSFYDNLADEYQKQPGALPEQVMQLRQAGVKYETDLATRDKDTLANYGTFHDQTGDEIDSIRAEKDPAKQAALVAQKLPEWQQRAAGLNDPSFVQTLQGFQYNGPQSLDTLATLNGALTASTKRAKDIADASEADARAKAEGKKYEGGAWWDVTGKDPVLANVQGMDPKVIKYSLYNAIDKITDDKGLVNTAQQGVDLALSQNRMEDANKVVDQLRAKQNDIDAEKALAPIKEKQEIEVRKAMAGGLDDLQKSTLTGPIAKESDEYAKLHTQLEMARKNLSNAKNGNELANALAPLQTILGVTSGAARGTARLNTGLLDAAGGNVGSIGRRVDAALASAGEGKLPKATLNEMGSLLDTMEDEQYQGYTSRVGSAIARSKLPDATGGFYGKDGSLISAGELTRQTQAAQKKAQRPPLESVLPGATPTQANRPPLSDLIK